MLTDPLADLLNNIKNATEKAKSSCTSKPTSKIIRNVLQIMKDSLFIGDFEIIDDNHGGVVVVQLIGAINKCGVIKPRFPVKVDEYEKYEKRYLPAKGFGLIIVSTSKGLMAIDEAKKKKIGGKLIAYIY